MGRAVLSLTAALLICASSAGAAGRGDSRLFARNTSGVPVVAYVGAARDAAGGRSQVFYGVYTGGDTLRPGGTVEPGSASVSAGVFVDYVRLADGWSWGSRRTEQAREIANRF